MKKTDTLLVGVDFSDNGDIGVLIVGRKNPHELVDVINAFEGEEAKELYLRLVGEDHGKDTHPSEKS